MQQNIYNSCINLNEQNPNNIITRNDLEKEDLNHSEFNIQIKEKKPFVFHMFGDNPKKKLFETSEKYNVNKTSDNQNLWSNIKLDKKNDIYQYHNKTPSLNFDGNFSQARNYITKEVIQNRYLSNFEIAYEKKDFLGKKLGTEKSIYKFLNIGKTEEKNLHLKEKNINSIPYSHKKTFSNKEYSFNNWNDVQEESIISKSRYFINLLDPKSTIITRQYNNNFPIQERSANLNCLFI